MQCVCVCVNVDFWNMNGGEVCPDVDYFGMVKSVVASLVVNGDELWVLNEMLKRKKM